MTHGLYVHIPFCAQKCHYCGFYSVTDRSLESKYTDALLTEIRTLPKVPFDTIYIGGGTPSVLGGGLFSFIESMIGTVNYTGKEFTVEVNPESVSESFCRNLTNFPVTRVSMGVQSLNGSVSKLLGRIHSAETALNAYNMLRSATDCAVNLDLIYDIPTVDYKIIRDTVLKIINLSPEHISAYSYSNDTGYLAKTDSDNPFQMEEVISALENAGYAQYEVSNFAKTGHESRHNLKYWQMEPYYGVGASAHSMISENGGRLRYSHTRDVSEYINDPACRSDIELYDGRSVIKESIVFGLRYVNGIDLLVIEEKFGKIDKDIIERINILSREGLLECYGQKVKVSRKGLLLLDSVMSYLWR